MKIKSYLDAYLEYKIVLVRVDFNVPIKDGRVEDNTRLVESIPTIKYLLKQKCKVILLSHLGRPDGKPSEELSLSPVAKAFGKLLGQKIFFARDCVGTDAEKVCNQLKAGQVALLENLRFHPEEEQNNSKFARQLSLLGDIFINDAFGTAHRAHASTVGITKFLPSYAGALMLKEVENLSRLFTDLRHPFALIVGGAKIDTKIDIITSFAGKADFFLMGGGIANTFLAAKGQKLGSSLVEKDKIKTAREISTLLLRKNRNLVLPSDYVISETITNFSRTDNTQGKNLGTKDNILDLGKNSAKHYASIIATCRTIVWNGPMGVYEMRPFRSGTKAIAQAIAAATKKGALSILGGGDTIDALKVLKISPKQFTHVSTGGGAMLEYLEKGSLPGIAALEQK